jgi:DNA-binding CsgD family transcriptional regulator
LHQLRTKLEARTTVHAVARAIALGIIPADTALFEYEWPLPDDLPEPDPLTPREHHILRLLQYGTPRTLASLVCWTLMKKRSSVTCPTSE